MRRLLITDLDGTEIGAILEQEDGTLQGEGKGRSLLEQAPGKTFEDWLEADHHSKYLHYTEQTAA